MPETNKPQLNPYLRMALDIGPLLLFFFINSRFGIFAATAVFMVTVLIALAVSYAMTRHVAVMPLVTAVVVIVFGGLTLILHDETFIKLKPTIIYVLFGGILGVGLLMGRSLLAMVFDQMFNLTDEGWRKLTVRWVWFFFVLAVLNEVVWRTQTTDFWVSFKVFGVVPLTFLFGALQFPLLQRHEKKDEASAAHDR